MSIAYTNHIGHSSRDKHTGKNTAIFSISDLAATEKHNNHDYTIDDVSRMQSDIDLDLKHLNSQYVMNNGKLVKVEGHLDLEATVRRIYEEQFAEAVADYNQKQINSGHPERQINSYIEKISEDKQQEVAVEGLIQFGSIEDWEAKKLEDRVKVVPLLLECLEETCSELKGTDKEFIIAGVSIHLNEGTPHLHYVGVPVQNTPEAKNGLKKRVKKTAVFTKESLGNGLQDNVRTKIEPKVKELFGWEFDEKKTGRNEDREKKIHVNEKLKEEIKNKQKELAEQQLLQQEIASKTKQMLDDYKTESAGLQAEILSLEEDKHLIQTYEEYDYEVTTIDEKVESWADELNDILDTAEQSGTPPKLLERMLQSVLRIMEDAADALRRRIDRIKIFEQLHDIIFPNAKRLEHNLNDVIASAEQGRRSSLQERQTVPDRNVPTDHEDR